MLRYSGEETVVLILHRNTGEKTILGSPAGITFLVTEKDIELKFKSYCSGWFKTGTDQMPREEEDSLPMPEDSDHDFYEYGNSQDSEAHSVIMSYKTDKLPVQETLNPIIYLQTDNFVQLVNSDATHGNFAGIYKPETLNEIKDVSEQDINVHEDLVPLQSTIEEKSQESKVNKMFIEVSEFVSETVNDRLGKLSNESFGNENFGNENYVEDVRLIQNADNTEHVIKQTDTDTTVTAEGDGKKDTEIQHVIKQTDNGTTVTTEGDGKKNTEKQPRIKESLVCKVCNKSLRSKRNLRNHMQTHGSKTCEVCNETLPSIAKLNNHLLKHRTQTYNCEVCDQSFNDKLQYNKHRKTHNCETLKCQVCEVIFSSVTNLRNHKSLHQERKQFKCEVCLREFRLKRYLTEHMKTHDSNNKKVCKICAKAFASSKGFKTHMQQIHTKQERFACETCGKEFYSKTLLNLHWFRKHKDKKYPCPHCEKVFKSSDALNNHMNWHTKDDTYTCEVCGLVFYIKSTFQQHLRKHDDKYSSTKCRYCNKGFRSYSAMATHVKHKHLEEDRIHTNPILKTCRICEKVFSLSKPYRAHMDMHLGIKHHKCLICGTGFSDPSNLTVHVRTHSTKKSFKCAVCTIPVYFISEIQLIEHMTLVHDNDAENLQSKE